MNEAELGNSWCCFFLCLSDKITHGLFSYPTKFLLLTSFFLLNRHFCLKKTAVSSAKYYLFLNCIS